MKQTQIILTDTQKKFIKYFAKNLESSNRIIFYGHNGHLGLKYTIYSQLRKVKILKFSELKNKTGKNLFFRILNILTAIFTFIINHFKNVDVKITISTILNNLENIYLGIDKSNEFLKYLNIKKCCHRYIKPKYVIKIEDEDIQSIEDIRCLKLLCTLIKIGKINNTVLMLSGKNMELLNIDNMVVPDEIPFFELTFDDLKLLGNLYSLEITENFHNIIDIIRRFGIQFFIDNYNYFDLLTKTHLNMNDWIKKIDWLMNLIINEKNIDPITSRQIYHLLEFASFFNNTFSKLAILNFRDNELQADNLNLACEMSIVDFLETEYDDIPFYFFRLHIFKEYFNKKYIYDLQPLPKYIYEYFRTNFPFEYLSALNILRVDSSFVDFNTQQSLIITGYYYSNVSQGGINYDEFIRYTTKDSISMYLINIYEEFKYRQKRNFEYGIIDSIILELQKESLNVIASCAAYSLVLQILKENYMFFKSINFGEILAELKNQILNIHTNNDYELYWQLYFKSQYVALSLEDESTEMSASRKFLRDIKNMRNMKRLKDYIKKYNLRGFERIDLLSFSLGYDNAGDVLEELYRISEESTVIKELARINYSAYLLENKYFLDAEKILKKTNRTFLFNINVDTYCANLNNLYLSQFKTKTISLKKYISLMTDLLKNDISLNDKLICENNLYTTYLMCKELEKEGERHLLKNVELGNPYNAFFAVHNLLSYYFTKNDVKKFNDIYKKIKIPKLLKSATTFFCGKFKWMADHLGENIVFEGNPQTSNTPSCYYDMYLMGSTERWFE